LIVRHTTYDLLDESAHTFISGKVKDYFENQLTKKDQVESIYVDGEKIFYKFNKKIKLGMSLCSLKEDGKNTEIKINKKMLHSSLLGWLAD